MTTDCPQCGENKWSSNGTIPIMTNKVIDYVLSLS